MSLATLIGVYLCLVAVLADLWLSARHSRPKAKRAEQRDDARRAVLAAEQRYGPGKGQDKRQLAVAHLLELHPGTKAARAGALVEHAVSELKK